MTTTEPRPAFLVRVDEERAGDRAGLLHYSIRERIEEAIAGAAKRWDVDPAAVTVELQPWPSPLVYTPAPMSPEERAELRRKWLEEHKTGRVTHLVDETEWVPGDYGGTVGSLTDVPIPVRRPWWRRALAAACWWRE